MEKIIGGFIILLLGALTILLVLLVYELIETNRHCQRWETKTVYQEPWTQFIYSGKTMIPIMHPGRDVQKDVCVEPKE